MHDLLNNSQPRVPGLSGQIIFNGIKQSPIEDGQTENDSDAVFKVIPAIINFYTSI